jgi:ribonuclease-3
MKPLKAFQKRLGYRFRKAKLLEAALTHPSYRYEDEGVSGDNQRLEFLGDAVLGLQAAEALYAVMPELDEGAMTQFRSRISNKTHLAELGRRWELGDLLLLGKGEANSGGSDRDSNLADAVEAVIGAIYLDGGPKAVRKLFLRHLVPDLDVLRDAADSGAAIGNPKGLLQEWTQKQNGLAPSYTIVAEHGPQHDRVYEAAVTWNDQELARGTAPSKRAAEAAAAENAMNVVQRSPS